MPEPMITMSECVGREGVVRWWRRKGEGSECQKEALLLGQGRLAGGLV